MSTVARVRRWSHFGLASLVLLGLVVETRGQDRPQSRVTVETTEQGVRFRDNEREVLFYQRAMKSENGRHARANYIHPLYDLDGNVLTEDFPADHRHHRGVFWAWHQTLADGKRMGDAWLAKDFGWQVKILETEALDSGAARLTASIDWTSPQWESGKKPLARERLALIVHPQRATGRLLDFRIRIEPLVDALSLGGSEDKKGYGGFSVRVKCPQDLKFFSGARQLAPQVTAVEGEAWLDIVGTFGSSQSGVLVLTDEGAPKGKQPWILRQKRSMQNPAWPGREPTVVQRQQPLDLHYGLVVHRGKLSAEQAQQWQAEFLGKTKP